MCDRWQGETGYANFLSDMGRAPSAQHSIDRHPDPNGNYDPSNARWADHIQQGNNRRDNKWIEHNGKRMTHVQWSRFLGGNSALVNVRINNYGWDEISAITTPVGGKRKKEK